MPERPSFVLRTTSGERYDFQAETLLYFGYTKTPAKKGGDVPTLPGRPNEHEHKPGTAPHTHDRPLGYGVGNANVIFAFDTRDRLPVLYPGGVRPADIAADLPLLAQGDAP